MSTTQRFIVLTPFVEKTVVEKMLQLFQLSAQVVELPEGIAVVATRIAPEFTDWDIAELLGEDSGEEAIADLAAEAIQAAETALDLEEILAQIPSDYTLLALGKYFSTLSPYGIVHIQADLGNDIGGEIGVSGLVKAQQLQAGKVSAEIPAGLLLNTLSQELEDLVLGN